MSEFKKEKKKNMKDRLCYYGSYWAILIVPNIT